jgi:hypothetical protein
MLPNVFAAARLLRRDDRGSAALLIAPLMLVMVGAAALGLDTMNAFTMQEQLRTAAQASATAAVFQLPDEDAALATALRLGGKNAPNTAEGTVIANDEVEFGHWHEDTRTFEPDPDTETVNAIRVTASLTEAKGNPLQTWFGQVIGVETIEVAAAAVATTGGGTACILALDPSGSKALELKSNSRINTPNCEVHVHSTASDALSTDSNATVDTARNCIAGNYSENSNSEITPDPETDCEPMSDPFATRSAPSVGSCNYSGKTVDNQTVTLNPGVYCNGLTIKNNAVVTFNPGVYIIKDGKFLVDGNARVTGTRVGFYLTGSSSLLEFNSNTQVSLTAPESGPLQGMIFFQNRNNSGTHRIDSNVAATLEGALYFPNGTFLSNSNSQMGSGSSCLMLVAKRIQFDSNAGMSMTADYSQCPWMPNVTAGRHSKIVG